MIVVLTLLSSTISPIVQHSTQDKRLVSKWCRWATPSWPLGIVPTVQAVVLLTVPPLRLCLPMSRHMIILEEKLIISIIWLSRMLRLLCRLLMLRWSIRSLLLTLFLSLLPLLFLVLSKSLIKSIVSSFSKIFKILSMLCALPLYLLSLTW